MANREIILQKINAQEREWINQLRNLQLLIVNSDTEKQAEFQRHFNHLSMKLQSIGAQTNAIRNAQLHIWDKNGDKIVHCWEELVHNVDYVIANYKRIFSQ